MLSRLDESILFKRLGEDNPGLAESVRNCWGVAEPLLRHAAAANPRHTSHGPDHALAVVDILDHETEPVLPTLRLTSQEIYILLCAGLLHDIGMVGPVSGSDESRDQVRQEHHVRTMTYILVHGQDLYLRKEYVEAIADVAAAHRKLDIERDIRERPIGLNSPFIPRTKLCAALLRLADECPIA